MNQASTLPVLRTISVPLEEFGRTVLEEPVYLEYRADVMAFAKAIYPGQAIEHLGRFELFGIHTYRGGICQPSSLFFQAVHEAFAEHHALGLRPEVLMYLINSVIAETVRRHPDDYRALFSSDATKLDIHVRHDDLVRGNPESPWGEAISMFEAALRPYVPSLILEEMLPEFSTGGGEARIASLVSFMDAAAPYYDYHTHTLCGIPRIVLFGEAADYRQLVTSAKALEKHFTKHLSVYFESLIPVLEHIALTAEGGDAGEDFWGQTYKQFSHSGTSAYSGWISAFVWYVHKEDWQTKTNPLVVKDTMLADWTMIRKGYGIDSGSEPSHVSRVPFSWHYRGKALPMHFIGGVLGVDILEGALTPALSYGVLRAE